MPVHVQGIELQAAAIIEGHVATDTIERLTRGDDRGCTVGRGAQQPLHRTSVEIVGADSSDKCGRAARWDLRPGWHRGFPCCAPD